MKCKSYLFFLLFAALTLLTMYLLAKIAVAPIGIQQAYASERVEFIMPELKAICACESVGNWNAEPRQWDSKGNVLRGRVVPQDIGQCQINATYHEATAKKLGFDIYSYNGNIQMANYLYTKNGNRDWRASSKCWNK